MKNRFLLGSQFFLQIDDKSASQSCGDFYLRRSCENNDIEEPLFVNESPSLSIQGENTLLSFYKDFLSFEHMVVAKFLCLLFFNEKPKDPAGRKEESKNKKNKSRAADKNVASFIS